MIPTRTFLPSLLQATLAALLIGSAALPAQAAGGTAGARTAAPASADDLLEADQAFRPSTRRIGERELELQWDVAPGYYLYQAKLKFHAPEGVTLQAPRFEPALQKDDPNFGRVAVYRERMRVRVRWEGMARTADAVLRVTAQGCADLGLCYPPMTYATPLDLPIQAATADFRDAGPAGHGGATPVAAPRDTGAPANPGTAAATGRTGTATAATAATATAATTTAPTPTDESGRVARLLSGGSVPLVLASFLGFGLLLAFTPCVFPMIPILSGIIVGGGPGITRRRGFTLSLAYVLGMAITYTAAGVAAGLSGSLLSAALQNPWVLGSFALVFVALSLSMFGFYDLQLPAALQSRLGDAANRQGGSLGSVALMGALSALIVGPCVAAPLAGALLYIAQTGDAVLGGAALFMMAMGMGAPLLLLGLAAGSLLPRAGAWMDGVKQVFGVMLLGVAMWLLQSVLPDWALMAGWGALLLGSGVALHALDPLPAGSGGLRRCGKALGVALTLAGAAQFIGLLAGGQDPLQPLATLRGGAGAGSGNGGTSAATASTGPRFERVRTLAELQQRVAAADRPVLLDYYADWCVSCKEMEHLTFSDPGVRQRMDALLLLQVDVTANNDDDKALLKRHGLFGPPGILLLQPGSGQELGRVVGFQKAEPFAAALDAALGTTVASLTSEGMPRSPSLDAGSGQTRQ
ncbi:MAG: hypothetical protein RLY78_985 [Pseudomonadota bacterium]|jgi:thiol:disulfide interchange protein DsbD